MENKKEIDVTRSAAIITIMRLIKETDFKSSINECYVAIQGLPPLEKMMDPEVFKILRKDLIRANGLAVLLQQFKEILEREDYFDDLYPNL